MKVWYINKHNNNNIQNMQGTLSPLNIFLKIFALNCNVNDTTLDKSYMNFRYVIPAVILGMINFYSLYCKINNIYSQINVSIRLTDVVQMVFDFCQYSVDLLFVYKYGRHVSVEYFKQYGNIDKILGVTDYPVIKTKLIKVVTFFVCLWVLTSLCDFVAWVLSFGWLIPLMYLVAYVYFFIKILATLDLTAHAMHIECRLQSICDLIHDLYFSTEMPSDCIKNENWLYSDTCSRVLKFTNLEVTKNTSLRNYLDLKWLTRSYLMLIEQTAYINKMFGTRMVLNCLSFLVDMVRLMNITVRMIIGTQHTTYDSGCVTAVSSTLRLLTCVAVLYSLVHQCERVYRQNDRILNVIDHLVIDKKPDEKLRESAVELRNLIQSRPIYFNMANFFGLNYSLLVSISSVVVTYTIILLQSVN